MIEKKDIINAVKHIVRHNASPQKVQIMHPTREWFVILALSIVGVIAAALYSYIMYTWYDLRDDGAIIMETPTVPYRTSVVEEALVQYRELDSEYATRVAALGAILPSSDSEVETDTVPVTEAVDVSTTSEAVIPEADLLPIVTPDLTNPQI